MARLSQLQVVVVVVITLLCLCSNIGRSDITSDRAECTDQLVALSTCLAYVQGEAKSPTPDCCTGFEQVVSKGIKCICVLIKDRNDPSLGLKFDVYRALSLPAKCNLPPSNASTCPRLLSIPENSPQAKEFYKFEEVLEGKGSPTNSPANAGNAVKNSTVSGENHVSSGRRDRNLRVNWPVVIAIVFLFSIGGIEFPSF